MKWRQITVHTTVEAEDLVSMMLAELGVEGVQIENNVPLDEEDVKAMYIDILPEMKEDDGTSKVSFFLREAEPGEQETSGGYAPGVDEDGTSDNSYMINDRVWTEEEIAALLENVKNGLEDMRACINVGSGELEIGESEETDWRDSWKEFFKPIRIESVLILPSWLEVPEEYVEEVREGRLHTVLIDPGVAFGTGNHETTRLCIPGMAAAITPGCKVLDLGTGSGILGMAAVRMGAGKVTAVDIDPACETVLRDNIQMNSISEKEFRILIGNVLTDAGVSEKIMEDAPYDIAVANILAPVICSLAAPGAADRFVKDGGVFITSGILDKYETEVLEAFRKNPAWKKIRSTHDGEWVAVTAEREARV